MAFDLPKLPKAEKVIYREVTLSLQAFNRLKDWQRFLEATEGERMTNGELIDRLILAYPMPR